MSEIASRESLDTLSDASSEGVRLSRRHLLDEVPDALFPAITLVCLFSTLTGLIRTELATHSIDNARAMIDFASESSAIRTSWHLAFGAGAARHQDDGDPRSPLRELVILPAPRCFLHAIYGVERASELVGFLVAPRMCKVVQWVTVSFRRILRIELSEADRTRDRHHENRQEPRRLLGRRVRTRRRRRGGGSLFSSRRTVSFHFCSSAT